MKNNKSKNRMYRDIQFEKIAKETGLSYSYKDEFGVINLLKDFSLFRNFSPNKITNILEDKTELYESSFRVFDFEYRLLNLDHEEVFNQTVFFVNSKKLALPHFYMEPGRLFQEVGNKTTSSGIDFERFPLFSIDYWSKNKWKDNVSDALFYYFNIGNDWTIEGVNYFMIIYKKEKIIPTTDLMEFFQKGKELVDIFSKPI